MPTIPTHSRRPLTRGSLGAIMLAMTLASCVGTTGSGGKRSPDATETIKVSDRASGLPAEWQHGAFMEIFVRGWRDSDGDGIGDLRGVTQSLDYLRDLGIKGIWLMPITHSADGDHGYAVKDFRNLEPAYGSFADLDELLREAHARGIGVVMDYVMNHSAASHPLFVASASSPTSSHRDWYVWKDPAPTGWDILGKNPWYPTPNGTFFATFGPHMPDFNLENPATMDHHKNNLRFWLNRGLDGFRFDAVPHLVEYTAKDWKDQPGSYALMAHVKVLMSGYTRRHMVCEAPANPARWAAPYVCGSAFAFGMEHNFLDAARGKPEAIREVADYFKTAPLTMATMLSNHDIFVGERVWDQLNGDAAQYRLATATYLLLPGTPFIYYGEEIGMAGVGSLKGDSRLRTPMSWTADAATGGGFSVGKPFRPTSPNATTHNVEVALADPHSILNFYKAMLSLRNTLPAIARGSYEHALVEGSVLGYQRKLHTSHAVVVINYGSAAAMINVGVLPAGAVLEAAFPANTSSLTADAKGFVPIEMDAQSVRVYSVRQ